MSFSKSPRFLLILLCFTAGLGFAGTAPRAHADQSPAAASDNAKPAEHASEESETDAFRHSDSVKMFAGWMHMDTDSAARTFEYVNFAVLAGAVLFGLLKILPKTFRTNRENIQHRLSDARTATEQAHERLSAIEKRLARLDEEIAAISKQADKDGVEEEARIKASIEAERRRIVDSTAKDIAAAASAAQRELKRFAAGLAVDRAVQRIVLSEDDDRALLQEFTQSLSRQQHGGKN